jgi:hypothetical protein
MVTLLRAVPYQGRQFRSSVATRSMPLKLSPARNDIPGLIDTALVPRRSIVAFSALQDPSVFFRTSLQVASCTGTGGCAEANPAARHTSNATAVAALPMALENLSGIFRSLTTTNRSSIRGRRPAYLVSGGTARRPFDQQWTGVRRRV